MQTRVLQDPWWLIVEAKNRAIVVGRCMILSPASFLLADKSLISHSSIKLGQRSLQAMMLVAARLDADGSSHRASPASNKNA